MSEKRIESKEFGFTPGLSLSSTEFRSLTKEEMGDKGVVALAITRAFYEPNIIDRATLRKISVGFFVTGHITICILKKPGRGGSFELFFGSAKLNMKDVDKRIENLGPSWPQRLDRAGLWDEEKYGSYSRKKPNSIWKRIHKDDKRNLRSKLRLQIRNQVLLVENTGKNLALFRAFRWGMLGIQDDMIDLSRPVTLV